MIFGKINLPEKNIREIGEEEDGIELLKVLQVMILVITFRNILLLFLNRE